MTSNKEILVKRYWRPDSEVLEQHTVKSGARSFSSDMLLCQDHGLQPLKLRLLPILRLIGSYGADVDWIQTIPWFTSISRRLTSAKASVTALALNTRASSKSGRTPTPTYPSSRKPRPRTRN